MKEVIQQLIKFRDERNWKQFHTPENLSKSIVLEAAELLENFQWQNKEINIESIKDEIADIMTYCLFMCETFNLEPQEIILNKMEKNKQKYPIDKAYGSSKKYNLL